MTSKYPCPTCNTPLASTKHDRGASWACDSCGGVAMTLAMLRRNAQPALVDTIWSKARSSTASTFRRCPDCMVVMRAFNVERPDGDVELDGCVTCYFLWFDSTELTRLGVVRNAAVKIAVAKLEVETRNQIDRD